MNKRAQMTIIIVLVLVIIAAVIVYFGFLKSDVTGDYVDAEVSEVYDIMINCAKETTKESISDIMLYGGSYNQAVDYYFDNGEKKVPSKENLEEQIALSINNDIGICLSVFDGGVYVVSGGYVDTSVAIEDDVVLAKIKYPLTIKKEGVIYIIDEFDISVDNRIKEMHDVVYELVDDYDKDKHLCISCFEKISNEHNMSISVFEGEGEVVFVLSDRQMQEEDIDYNWVFVLR